MMVGEYRITRQVLEVNHGIERRERPIGGRRPRFLEAGEAKVDDDVPLHRRVLVGKFYRRRGGGCVCHRRPRPAEVEGEHGSDDDSEEVGN